MHRESKSFISTWGAVQGTWTAPHVKMYSHRDLPSRTMRILWGSSFVSRKSSTAFRWCSFSPLLRKPRRLSRDVSLEFLTFMMKRSSTSWNNSPVAQPYGSRRVKAVVFPEPAAPNTTASRCCSPPGPVAVNRDEIRLRNENFRLREVSIKRKRKSCLSNVSMRL